jgi:hypothetical protein
LELDDLAPLFKGLPWILLWFEVLRNIKWNQPSHCNLMRTEHRKRVFPVR